MDEQAIPVYMGEVTLIKLQWQRASKKQNFKEGLFLEKTMYEEQI